MDIHTVLKRLRQGEVVRVQPNARLELHDQRARYHGRTSNNVVGKLCREHHRYFVRTSERDGGDIVVPQSANGGARDGQWVVCEITQPASEQRTARGRVLHVLGDDINVHTLSEAALYEFCIPHIWPAGVDAELHAFVDIATALDDGTRRDLRDMPFVTIDGDDARDFDDAVYAHNDGNAWRLVVAISDVSEYVKAGGALDEESLHRGNSVYFPRRVVPMLPEVLSNDLCSLKPHQQRLTLVCDMRVSSHGNIKEYQFYPALITSRARLTYAQVFSYMQKEVAPPAELRDALAALVAVFYALRTVRVERGALDMDIAESCFTLDDDGRVTAIRPAMRNDAHRLIEECMLAANDCAARFIYEHARTSIYRVHEQPTAEKVHELREFLLAYNIHLRGGANPRARDFAAVLAHPGLSAGQIASIQILVLRSLAQARYSIKNNGHFALASDAYTHFTSPIRRYPDLLVHRMIKAVLAKKRGDHCSETGADVGTEAEAGYLEAATEQCSSTERRAEQAVRDVVQRLKVQYMENKVGELFRGRVTGVTGFGLFVELQCAQVTGLLHIRALGDDYYHHDATRHELQGEHSGRRFCIGDELEVQVVRVNVAQGKMDLQLPGMLKRKPRRGWRVGGNRRGQNARGLGLSRRV